MLESLFNPESIAIIGASRTPGKLGYAILANVIESDFGGPIYPINPAADEILGYQVYPSLADLPGPVGLAVIVVPAKYVMAALEDCVANNVGSVIVISAGFRETGSQAYCLL